PSRIPALSNSSLNLRMAENISVGGITPASDAFDALTITMTFMTELLNLVDGDAIEVGHIRLSPCLTGGRSVLPLLSSRMPYRVLELQRYADEEDLGAKFGEKILARIN